MDNVFLEKLNSNQKEAVMTTEGYVRAVAGPGSGKTRTLVNRYGYLISACNISPENILCITFTNKAADVMKYRLKHYFGSNFSGFIYTFHGFCARILRDEIYHVNFPQSFSILDGKDLESIYTDIYQKFNLDKKEKRYGDFTIEVHSFKKNNINEYIDYLTSVDLSKTLNAPNYIVELINQQRKNYCLDFDDLIYLCLYIFNKYTNVLEKYQEKFQYVLVDEFQDVTDSEFEVAKLVSNKHKNLFVVGDPDQMIYTWRGAKDYITPFDKLFPTCKTVFLDTNYRSTPEIVNLSNSLIKHNTNRLDKIMKTSNPSFAKPIYYHAQSKELEGEWICKTIKQLLSDNVSANDIAIIYRTNRNSRFIEEALLKDNIPYRIYGSVGFYEREEIKDLLSYLRFLINFDDLSFKRIINKPSRLIGEKKIAFLTSKQAENGKSLYENAINFKDDKIFKGSKLQEFLDLINQSTERKENKVSDLLSFVYQKSGYEEKLMTQSLDEKIDNVSELLDSIKDYEVQNDNSLSLIDYIENITLVSNSDKDDDKDDKVKMMTAHISKGQEFKYVFVCALNENNFPISRATTLQAMEEERRLAYVAFTRAGKQLFLSDSEGFDYVNGFMMPSRFIFDIDENAMEWRGEKISNEQRMILNSSSYYGNLYNNEQNAVNIGQRVKHIVFGEGTVVDIKEENNKIIVKFDNLSTNRDLSMNSISKELSILNNNFNGNKSNNKSNHYDSSSDEITNDTFLSVNDIMYAYGMTRYRVMKIIHSGNIPTYKKGNKYLLKKDDLENYFKSIKRKNVIIFLITIAIIIILVVIFLNMIK